MERVLMSAKKNSKPNAAKLGYTIRFYVSCWAWAYLNSRHIEKCACDTEVEQLQFAVASKNNAQKRCVQTRVEKLKQWIYTSGSPTRPQPDILRARLEYFNPDIEISLLQAIRTGHTKLFQELIVQVLTRERSQQANALKKIEDPERKRLIIDERDKSMTQLLHKHARAQWIKGSSIVAIVGFDHLDLQMHWFLYFLQYRNKIYSIVHYQVIYGKGLEELIMLRTQQRS